MFNTPLGADFEDWINRKTGSAVTPSVDADGVITIASTAGDYNQQVFYLPGSPGDVVEFEIWGRAVTGEGIIAVEFDSIGANLVEATVSGDQLQKYRVICTVPEDFGETSLRVVIGTASGASGDMRFMRPSVTRKSRYAPTSVLAMGLIRKLAANGALELHPSYRSMGVTSLALDSDNSTIIVSLDAKFSNSILALPFASCDPNLPYVVNAGTVVASTTPATFKIGVRDFAGVKVDLTALGSTFQVFFKVEL